MLVEFSVTNYRSISETQTLSLVAGRQSATEGAYALQTKLPYVPAVLRVAGILGPNGSGKSTIVKAMEFFTDFVENSSSSSKDSVILVEPHVFDDLTVESPSTFEATFLFNKKLYQYGFSATKKRVYDEWMYIKESASNSRMKTVFRRSYEESGEYKWSINRATLSGEKDVWRRSTRENALFLSTAVMLNSEDLADPYEFICNSVRVIDDPRRLADGYSISKVAEGGDGWKKDIISFLADVDVRLDDITVEAEDFDPATDIPPGVPSEVASSIIKRMTNTKIVKKHETVRKTASGKLVKLSFEEESSGTQVLFALSAPIVHVLKEGMVLFVDEMNSTLHPLALQYIVNLFNSEKHNPMGAQLVFTGHETSVLEHHVLHRDQVWFTEKTTLLNTTLTPASSFKARVGSNFRRSYMTGRFGAVPLVSHKEFSYEDENSQQGSDI